MGADSTLPLGDPKPPRWLLPEAMGLYIQLRNVDNRCNQDSTAEYANAIVSGTVTVQPKDLPTNNRDAEKGADASVTSEYPSAIPAQRTSLPAEVGTSGDSAIDATAIPILAKAALQPNAKAADFKRLVEWVTHPDTEDDAEVTVIVQGCELEIIGEVYDYNEDRTDLECLTTINLTNQDAVARLEAARAVMERRSLPLFETQQAFRRPSKDDAIDLIEIANRMDYLRVKFDLPNEHEFEGMAKGIREIAEAVQRGE